MPSPIAHVAVGWALQRAPLLAPRPALSSPARSASALLGIAAFFSLLPDLPTAAGLLTGDPRAFHNQWEHSLSFVLLAAAAAGAIAGWSGWGSPGRWAGLALGCTGAHVVMDYFTVGRGVMLFWPLSEERFGAPVKLFYGLHWSDGWISSRHLWTLLSEAAFVFLLVWLVGRWRPPGRRLAPPAGGRDDGTARGAEVGR